MVSGLGTERAAHSGIVAGNPVARGALKREKLKRASGEVGCFN